jgi:hypothetical protein
MRPTAIYDLTLEALSPSRRTLLDEHAHLGSWHRVARKRKVNWKNVYNYALYGKVPNNKAICKRLGIKPTVTLNKLLRKPISEMPTFVLRWAFENREEML